MRMRNTHRPDTSSLRLAGIDTAFALTREQLELLAAHSDVLNVSAGDRLCRVGEYPRQFFVVVDGYVDVTDRSGCTRVAGPGTWIGGVELVTGVPHHETVVTRSDCRLVVIFGPALTLAVRQLPRSANPSRFPTRKSRSHAPPRALDHHAQPRPPLTAAELRRQPGAGCGRERWAAALEARASPGQQRPQLLSGTDAERRSIGTGERAVPPVVAEADRLRAGRAGDETGEVRVVGGGRTERASRNDRRGPPRPGRRRRPIEIDRVAEPVADLGDRDPAAADLGDLHRVDIADVAGWTAAGGDVDRAPGAGGPADAVPVGRSRVEPAPGDVGDLDVGGARMVAEEAPPELPVAMSVQVGEARRDRRRSTRTAAGSSWERDATR